MNFMNIVISLVAGLRLSGPDYSGYQACFDSMPDTLGYLLNLTSDYCGSGRTEWFYYLYISIFKSLNLSFDYFIFFSSALHCYLLAKLSKKFNYPNKFLFGYFCTVGFYFQFWYLKQGIATLILLIGIHYLYVENNQKKKGIMLYITSALIHNSSIFIEIFLFLVRKINIRFTVLLSLVFLLINLLDNNFFIDSMSIVDLVSNSKYSGYLNSQFDRGQIGLMSILCILFITLNFFYRSNDIGYYFLLIGLWTVLILGQIPLSGRISSYFMPLGVIFYFQFLFKIYRNNTFINFIYASFAIIYFIKTFIFDAYNLNQIKSIF